MRLLHRLEGNVPVWPFDFLQGRSFGSCADSGSMVVEIYTRVFILLAGLNGRKVRSLSEMNRAVAGLGSRPSLLASEPNDHETDVIIAAAGLRAIAGDHRYWNPPALTPRIARSEGWTFGVL